jgi:type IV pilus assembly protein PilO
MAITLDSIKKLSPQVKIFIIVIVIIFIGFLDWSWFLSDVIEQKTTLDKKLAEIHGQNKEKEKIARQLDKYKADVAALQDDYKVALQKLPDQREIPGLLLSVAQAGKEAGIESLLFEPKAAIPKVMDRQISKEDSKTSASQPAAGSKPATDGKKTTPQEQEPFYEEIPIAVTILGSFQNIVYFFEKVAKLPRIINISEISMGDRKDVKGKGYVINTSCTIKTYVFVDKKEKTGDKAK